MAFEIYTTIVIAFIVMFAAILFYIAATSSLMLISFVATRKLCVNTWFSTPGKWIAIFIAQIFVFIALKYNYTDHGTPIASTSMASVICSFAFGLVWATWLYTTYFKPKTKTAK